MIIWGVTRISDERRQAYLEEYKQRLLTINKIPAIAGGGRFAIAYSLPEEHEQVRSLPAGAPRHRASGVRD